MEDAVATFAATVIGILLLVYAIIALVQLVILFLPFILLAIALLVALVMLIKQRKQVWSLLKVIASAIWKGCGFVTNKILDLISYTFVFITITTRLRIQVQLAFVLLVLLTGFSGAVVYASTINYAKLFPATQTNITCTINQNIEAEERLKGNPDYIKRRRPESNQFFNYSQDGSIAIKTELKSTKDLQRSEIVNLPSGLYRADYDCEKGVHLWGSDKIKVFSSVNGVDKLLPTSTDPTNIEADLILTEPSNVSVAIQLQDKQQLETVDKNKCYLALYKLSCATVIKRLE